MVLFVDFYRNELAHSCDELFSYGIDVPGEYYLKEDDGRFRVTCFKRGNLMMGLVNVNEKIVIVFMREREGGGVILSIHSFDVFLDPSMSAITNYTLTPSSLEAGLSNQGFR